MFRSIALVTLLLATLPSFTAAQLPGPGERVRVLTNGELVTGTVEEVSEDVLRLRTGAYSFFLVDSDRIDRLEISVGREAAPGAALYVLAGGVLLGGAMGLAASPCESNCGFVEPTSRAQGFGMGALVGGVFALPIAVLVAVAARRDVWEPVDLPAHWRAPIALHPRVGPRGVGFEGSISVGHH